MKEYLGTIIPALIAFGGVAVGALLNFYFQKNQTSRADKPFKFLKHIESIDNPFRSFKRLGNFVFIPWGTM